MINISNLNEKLSNNSFSLITSPKTTLVNINDIKFNKYNIEKDEIFIKKYSSFISGKTDAYITRISLSKIKPGFYKRKTNRWKYFIDNIPKAYIDIIVRSIREGHRSILHLYINPNDKCEFTYVCPDDVAIYKAYKKLGIKKVPVMILGRRQELEESALIQKSFKTNGSQYNQYFYRVDIVNKNSFQSILGNVDNNDISFKLDKLYNIIDQLKTEHRNFHLHNETFHYHNIIFSMLIRTLECLKSIKILINSDLYLPAISIARNLYEITLTFYISWLCPSFLPFIQLANSSSFRELEKIWMNGDKNHENIDTFIQTMKYQYNIADSVIEKAKISPFGELYYKEYYSLFSKIVHHDFSVHARYKHTLIHGDEVIYDNDIKGTLLFMIDTCVTLIYTKISDDIGSKV